MNSENKLNLDILESILGTKILDIEFLKKIIRTNSSYLLSELETYRIFDEEETQVIDAIENIYKKLSKIIINGLSNAHFQMPIEMAIATKNQEVIKALFMNAAEKYGFDNGLQAQIDLDLEEIANKLNKRFAFDEPDLIHLIEASKSSNIQLEEWFERRSPKNKRQILKQHDNGTYYLAEIADPKATNKYTTGKNIPTKDITTDDGRIITKTISDNNSNINISSYPGAKELIGTISTDEIMKEVMKNLFDNLELCVDTYKFYYTKNKDEKLEDSVSIKNTAVLSDDSEFDFYYHINRWNLPHLLGIQTGEIISESTKKYFSEVRDDGSVTFPIDENSSAFTILKTLLKNKERIISAGGLIEENGKKYQIFPWEKIILKTSSFMRGDFFKTCFCLVQLDHGINSPKEKVTSISSTKYSDGMVDSRFDAKKVLRDLINTAKQKKDFIFRTFVEDYDTKGKFLGYVPSSIDTGKSESIITNNGERIQTLNRYRQALQGNPDGGMVVQSIENENMRKRIFSPIEQYLTSVNISSGLNVNLQISEKTAEFEEKLRKTLEDELDKELLEIITPSPKKNNITR